METLSLTMVGSIHDLLFNKPPKKTPKLLLFHPIQDVRHLSAILGKSKSSVSESLCLIQCYIQVSVFYKMLSTK